MTQQPSEKGKVSRRDFLKLLAAAGTVMSFTPFIDWGKFMPNPIGGNLQRAPVVLPDGSQANAKTFPANSSQSIRYPETGDRVLDEEPFRRWQFIRLPPEYGGDKEDASSFRAYSMVCLHLWCLWKYWPGEGRKRGECPCHGSMYDARTGKAFAGPASLQSPPSNVLPRLDLEVDNKGDIYIVPPVFSANANGIVGYGRLVKGLNV